MSFSAKFSVGTGGYFCMGLLAPGAAAVDAILSRLSNLFHFIKIRMDEF